MRVTKALEKLFYLPITVSLTKGDSVDIYYKDKRLLFSLYATAASFFVCTLAQWPWDLIYLSGIIVSKSIHQAIVQNAVINPFTRRMGKSGLDVK